MEKWSEQRAWEWYNSRPWIRGFNYISADSVNRIEQWQEYRHEEKEETFRREFALAREVGFNAIRSILPFEVWYREHDGFMSRLENFLRIADENKLGVMLCFGNDCCVPAEKYSLPPLGEQRVDLGYHGGMAKSPHDLLDTCGKSPLDIPEYAEAFYKMVEEIVAKYKDDSRVIVWDIFNEIGNSRREMQSVPHMQKFFEIARAQNPSQPLTACAWTLSLEREIRPWEQIALDLSDIISYHDYGRIDLSVGIIALLKEKYNRPIFNTEWLHRIQHNNVASHLPIFWLENIACFNWGFVVGKSQNNEPWEAIWRKYEAGQVTDYDFTKWQHELYRPNLRPYDPHEIETFKKYFKRADDAFTRKTQNAIPKK